MSEMAGATGGAATSAPATQNSGASGGTGTPNAGQSGGGGTHASQSGSVPEFGSQIGAKDGANAQGAQTSGDDSFEEIALGSVKGKVPKEIAKAIKDFEKNARQRMQEAAELRKRAQSFESLDLEGFAKQRGVDLDAIAEERLAKKYELAQLSPEQRELREYKEREAQRMQMENASKSEVLTELEQLLGKENIPKGAEQATKEQLQGYLQQQKQVYAQAEQQLNNDVAKAWRETGLPEHPQFGVQMSLEMLKHQKRTGQTLQPAEAAARVKANFVKHASDVISKMDAKAIHETLGKDVIQKIRDFDIERVTSKQASQVGQSQNRPGNTASGKTPPMNEIQYRKFMRDGKL